MSRRRQFLLGLLTLTGFAAEATGQGQYSPRAIVIFIDDLHLPFPSTPSLRRGLTLAIEQFLTAERMIALVSDGPSSISQPPTTDRAVLLQMANRASGSGTPRNVMADPTPGQQDEARKREVVAQKTLEDVVNAFQNPRTRVIEAAQVRLDGVLYVTERRAEPTTGSVRVVVTRPEGMAAAAAELLTAN